MNPYNINISQSNLEGPLAALDVLYDGIPETSGCENCAEVNGDDVDWCCKLNTPSMYYIEFLKVFKEVGDDWIDAQKTELMLRAVRSYLDNSLNKGCVFYNDGCTIYKSRPLSCRNYGVIPQDSWDKRWEILKERQGEDFEAKPQCSLVSAEKEITSTMEDKWFLHTKKCEERIGIPLEVINRHDLGGGSYRTFHDHILLEFFGERLMSVLTKAKMTDSSDEDIDRLIEELRKQLNEQQALSS